MTSIIDKLGGLRKAIEYLYVQVMQPAAPASPAGADTEVQVNVSSAFGTRSGFTHDGSTLGTGGDVSIPEGDTLKIGSEHGSGAAACGLATLNGSGEATVSTTKITANSLLLLTSQGSNANPTGIVAEKRGTRNAGADFTIKSTAGIVDSSVDVAWFILEPT